MFSDTHTQEPERQERDTLATRWRAVPEPFWLSGMVVFQVLMLLAIRLTGTAQNQGKLLPLLIYSLLAGIAVFALPAGATAWLQRIRYALAEHESRVLLGLAISIIVVGIVYARFQRIWPWDEEYSYEAARIVAEGGIRSLLRAYSELPWLGNQHPPLMMIAYGYALRFFGDHLFVMRLVALALGMATVGATYLLGRELYDRDTGLLAALFLVSFPLFLRQSTAAMTDVPVTFFFTAVLLLTVRLLRKPDLASAIGGAALIGAGLITKYTMAFIYPFLLSLVILLRPFRTLKGRLALMMLLPAGVAALWVALAHSAGVLAGQLETITGFIGILFRDSYGLKVLSETLITRLPAAVGPYNLPLLALGGLALLERGRLPEKFFLLWIAIVSLMLVVTLPDHRYFMIMFPALAIAIARGTKAMSRLTERAVIMALLYGGGMLYLFVDWTRVTHVFLP